MRQVCRTNPLSQLGLEVGEDEVGEGLGHCSHVGDIVSHHCVLCSEAIWEVAYHGITTRPSRRKLGWGGGRRVRKSEREG